jgi:hypothetical protein
LRRIRGEHNLADSDELLQKGILKLARCSPPLDALLLQDDPQSEALLPDHLLELEVISDSSMVMNSGEVFGELGEDREEEKGTEAELGFGSGARLLIGHQGRRHESWHGRRRCWRHLFIRVIQRWKTLASPVGPACQCIPNRYARLGFGGFSGWAAVVGFGPGKLLSFFCFDSFPISVFCFEFTTNI